MEAALTKDERFALLDDLSQLIENIYICLSHSEENTYPFIESGEFIPREKVGYDYIWHKLIEVKKTLDNFKRFGFLNLVSSARKKPTLIYSKDMPTGVEDDFRRFVILTQFVTKYSSVWHSGLRTYLLASPVLEKVVVLRDKVDDAATVQPKAWQSLAIKGHFKYYPDFNRVKLLLGHDTDVVDAESKTPWYDLTYLDYNIQDVQHLLNTTALKHFVIWPDTERLSIFFTVPCQLISCRPGLRHVILEVQGFYKDYAHQVYMDVADFDRAFHCHIDDFEKTHRGKFYLLACKADISTDIVAFQAKEIDLQQFKERGFLALLRFRKVIDNKRDKRIEHPQIAYEGDKIYYVPKIFADEKDSFMHYILHKGTEDIAAVLKVMKTGPKLRFYFNIFPEFLQIYRREVNFLDVYPPLVQMPSTPQTMIEFKQDLDIKVQRAVKEDANPYVPVDLTDPRGFNLAETLTRLQKLIRSKTPFETHVFINVEFPVKQADETIGSLERFKDVQLSGHFLWKRNMVFGSTRRAIYEYIYNQSMSGGC